MSTDEVADIYEKHLQTAEKKWEQASSLDALKAELSKISRKDIVETVANAAAEAAAEVVEKQK